MNPNIVLEKNDLLLFDSELLLSLGYPHLAETIFLNIVQTLVLMLAFWLVSSLLRDLSVGLAEGKGRLQLYLRQKMGLKPYEKEPGIYWLYLILKLFLWTGLVIGLLSIWGLSQTRLRLFFEKIVKGIEIGDFIFSPLKIIAGIAVFSFLLILFRVLRDKLFNQWITKSGMEPIRAETASTITTYLGFTTAILFGLLIAGVDFTDLAIIAGALSLGIGIGLQNVVNNFVSGLILLFERPIKTGDWILVGKTEGYVRKVSIRSTLIQAFDRSDVIVPNSELTSQHVVNYMLRDNLGRVRVPFHVAVGSDVEKIKSLLLEIANAHPGIITNGSAPDPAVFFLGFGDIALHLELRVFITNIDQGLQIKSDLNFAIYKAFKEKGIEFPTPPAWPTNTRSQN